MSEEKQQPEGITAEEPHGLDTAKIRRLLAMTPAERLRTAMHDAKVLAGLDAARRRGRR